MPKAIRKREHDGRYAYDCGHRLGAHSAGSPTVTNGEPIRIEGEYTTDRNG